MKKLLLLLLLITANLQAQHKFEAPNYKHIKKVTHKENSEFYFPKLMERFKMADTTMNLEEKRLLYYGYSFQPEYKAYAQSDYSDSLNILLRKELTEPRLDSIIYYADKLLEEDPFNLGAINNELFAYEKKQMEAEFNKRLTQAYIIIDALMSSGDGKSKDTAFYVIYISHEYAILNYLGFEFGGEQALIEHYDFLNVAENEANLEGLYFDVSRNLDSLNSMFKD